MDHPKSSKNEPVVVGIDNAEHTGTESWLFIQELLITHTACVIMTFTEEFDFSVPFIKNFIKQQYLCIVLEPYNEEELGNLICQVLNVEAIHKGFLSFFREQSQGNALRLQEILMLPILQKHFCIVPIISVTKSTLESNFQIAENAELDPSKAKVCDILDTEGLWSIKLPTHLLDLVRDHTTGLNPEEQMLMRKCALLGDTFSLYILEAVCPEYSMLELRAKAETLLKKNILTFQCNHLEITESKDKRSITLREVPSEFCIHPLKFYSEFLKKSVINSMPESQRERLNLYLADLLTEIDKCCDSCKRGSEMRRLSPYFSLLKNFRIPLVDLRMCQCLNLRTHILMQVEYHLNKGNGDISKRINMLLKAAENGLEAGNAVLVESILNKIKRLLKNVTKENGDETKPNAEEIATERLKAEVKLYVGKNSEALRNLKHAMLLISVIFPEDIRKKHYKKMRFEGKVAIEEHKCLAVGCYILLTLGDYDIAYRVAKLQLKILLKCGHTFTELVKSNTLLLRAVSKTKPGKKRETEIRKWINETRQLCFNRLTEYPLLDIPELRAIASAFKIIVRILFENKELSVAEDLGRRSFQLLKLVKFQEELVNILNLLARIYFYQKNYDKCSEMINHLQDAYQQRGDSVSEAIYYMILVKFLRISDAPSARTDRMVMCCEYATRCAVVSSHPKYVNKLFCLNAEMALWSQENNLREACGVWYERAKNLQNQIRLDNYWASSGSLCLIRTNTLKLQEKFFVYTEQEASSIKHKMQKELETIQSAIYNYTPVLDSDVKETTKFFHKVLNECKVLNS
ncbi:uncharacterized protein LOC118182478 [Stegodyphus dumicola]|uniref:uncharacterized protein LOC118182478 n=1 Tax=Stegodyphus dumicola TaxID=202533 RepID=UPI0015A8072F|nr:uncharacterized protein LOC118182478 [Stegodyphus dumicola]